MAGPLSAVASAEALDSLATRAFLVVSGKGGVGRTTVAASLGLALAQRGRRVLVGTTGHDDRLAWMLGTSKLEPRPVLVAPRLSIQRLDPQVCVREYGAIMLHSERVSDAVFDNRVVRRLLRAIPGLDDFAVVGKAWHEATRGGVYDVVVFDGPATGHLRYVLGIPRAILRAVPQGPLTREAELMQSHFEQRTMTAALLVGVAEPWPLTELGELARSLRDDVGMHVAAVVVNALWPADVPLREGTIVGAGPRAAGLAEVAKAADVGRRQREVLETWRSREWDDSCPDAALIPVPWDFRGIDDSAGLHRLLDRIDVHHRVSA